uniref:Glutathione S-transferase n=1 Tax=Arcella intermedia TaxID=1963864 RepID=A0A6B2LER2_9EUKA
MPQGKASFQLYSLGTPNGIKAAIILEELGIDYDAHVINIMTGDQFTSGFVSVNPNSKIPAAVDKEVLNDKGEPLKLFESGSIMLYLADKHKRFIPSDAAHRAEVLNWLFWQMAGQGPMAGNFGHFMVYAPDDKVEARNYGVSRYGMETQRLLSVLDLHLKGRMWMVGEEYTIADMAIFPWVNQLRTGYKHKSGIGAAEFLSVESYGNVIAWANRIAERPAVQRGLTVCTGGKAKPWLEAKV